MLNLHQSITFYGGIGAGIGIGIEQFEKELELEKIIEKKKELELNQKELQGIGAELEFNERNLPQT